MNQRISIPAAYLRKRIVPVCFYIAEALVFMLIAALYGYEGVLENMTYALGLVSFFGACYLAWDYVRYREKYRTLWKLLLAEERSGGLPQTLWHCIMPGWRVFPQTFLLPDWMWGKW